MSRGFAVKLDSSRWNQNLIERPEAVYHVHFPVPFMPVMLLPLSPRFFSYCMLTSVPADDVNYYLP